MERAAYRIVDANFNRAREAARVIEDFCRFALNSQALSRRAKQLRHELSTAVGKLDTGALLCSRDTLGDVGIGARPEQQIERRSLNDSFTAACKRLVEALRTIAEAIQPEYPHLAGTIEKLRYDAYTLEKDIVLFAEPAEKFNRVQLYVIITSTLPSDVISLTTKCVVGGADCIQLRTKGMNDDSLLALAVEFVQICRQAGVLSIINDRVDVAVAAGADGVHLGQHDLLIEHARKLSLTPLIIGKSTHSLKELARYTSGGLAAARDKLPTYVSLGPVFPSPTKPAVEVAGLNYVTEGIQKLKDTGISHVAIGGITPGNVQDVLRAGAQRIAVSSAVTAARDPSAACRALLEKIAAFRQT